MKTESIRQKRTSLVKLGMVLFAAVFLFSGFMITTYFVDRAKSQAAYDSLQNVYYSFADMEEEDQAQAEQHGDNTDTDLQNNVMASFHPLLEKNEDTVGWIRIDNTVVDYPVVQGNDNEFYLNYTFNKEKNKSGALFMDFRNSIDFLDQNTIIYGHNMMDGSMFGELKKYRNESFFEEINVITFDSLYEEMEWEIFAVFLSDTSFNYIRPNFPDENAFQQFIQTVEEKVLYSTELEITNDDHILTLSTCASDFDDARLVVMAKRVDN
ncbi:SrtB family sortase [Anaerobacillus arseniciselenatis]|uniref:SrtB family sortase n=1 Tax=Anaerobacillus arseniciselenatis TaxID=85682 RepID=A0A1S2LRE0_9BACI|nr:class B sortase [Anaerobacillus arseniciselenatis]OIJ14894.1 SrtB family sortase [Anaerobacillus arseniciselenatis]